MAFFGLFNREKKETLDQGLAKTKENVFSKLTRAVAGKSKVDDEVLDNLEEVLVTSDVGVETTLRIIERIEERVSRDKYLNTSELNSILVETTANESLFLISFIINNFFFIKISMDLIPSFKVLNIFLFFNDDINSFLLGPPSYKYFILTFLSILFS